MIFDEGFVRINNMTETMNELNAKFENYLWEYHLSHETDPSIFSSRPKVSLCDEDEILCPLSFILLKHL